MDLSKLTPGVHWSVAELEQITGVERNSRDYSFRVLQFRNLLEQALKRIAKNYTFAVIKDELRILTPSEASDYNASAFDNGMKQMRRSQRRLLAVDASKLTQDQKSDHEKRIGRQSMLLSLLRQKSTPATSPAPNVLPKVLQ